MFRHSNAKGQIGRVKKNFMHETQPVTGPWGSLLVRMLRIIDAIELWNTLIVEQLYIRANGQVDKFFPAKGDILAVYLVAGRIYKGSPQGWYIVTAIQFKQGESSTSPFFWTRCTFHADIPPVPDTAVPWKGQCDPWLMREKLTNKPMWLRLCSTEDFGCSYYNLSDWVKAKRNADGISPTSPKCVRDKVVHIEAPATRSCRQSLPNQRSPICTRKRSSALQKHRLLVQSGSRSSKIANTTSPSVFKSKRARSKFSEYILIESSAESSDCDISKASRKLQHRKRSGAQSSSIFDNTFFTLTTGKMSNYIDTSASTSTSASTRTTPGRHRTSSMTDAVLIPTTSTKYSSRLSKDPKWMELREETCFAFLNLILARLNETFSSEYAKDISERVEEETVFSKCMHNEDRYIGLRRAVCGILKQFDCLLDSLEMLIPVDDELRQKLNESQNEHDSRDDLVLYINPFNNHNP